MTKVLITGMSGTGKSSAINMLQSRGHRTVDTDTDTWSEWVTSPDGSADWIWRADAITDLLVEVATDNLFVSGCKTNQGEFYPLFDHIVLLSAPTDVLLARIEERTNNTYGKRTEERTEVLHNLKVVEPKLRATATLEIDATAELHVVVAQLESLV